MSIGKAALLGLIQGVTSVFPVSSSGHVALLGHLLGEEAAGSLSFMALLHLGTLIAVIWSFREDVLRLLRAWIGIGGDLLYNVPVLLSHLSRPSAGKYRPVIQGNYRKLAVLLALAMVPELIVALILRRFSFLGASSMLITAMGFFITALMLLISSFAVATKKNPKLTRYKDAALAGVLQGLAIVPGISRLGMSLSAGSLSGLERPYMVRFAFLMSIPAILGGLVFLLPAQAARGAAPAGFGAVLTGIVVSAVVSYALISFTRRILSRRTDRGFAIYTLIIGIICTVVYFH